MAQVFSCEFFKLFKNTLFTEHLQVTASDNTFIERKTSTFCMKSLRINTTENNFNSKKAFHFLKYKKIDQMEDFCCLIKKTV